MATQISEITGQPFSKEVRDEIERRKSLQQGYETSSELYQPYFILKKLNSLDKVLETRRVTEDDYSKDPYNKLGLIFGEDENIDYTFGLSDMIGTEFRGLLGIANVSIELTDFAFYVANINFEINDIGLFRDFKNTWFNFGIPVEMEFGRYSPLNNANNVDINPNKEKRTGVVVKFDYNLQDNGRGVSGTLKVYSTTWLSVLREGNSDTDDIEKFRENFKRLTKDYHDVKLEQFKGSNIFNIQDFILAFMKEDLSNSLYKEISTTGGVGAKGVFNETERVPSDSTLYTKILKNANFNNNSVDKKILSTFSLDPELYASKAYYFLSFRAIEELVNSIYWEDNIRMKAINEFSLTGIEINNTPVKGNLKSIDFEDVLINPLNKKRDGKFLTNDIYISIVKIFELVGSSAGVYSFLNNLFKVISKSTLGNINLKKVIFDIYDESETITKGITLYDESSLVEYDQPYSVFDVHNPEEKISNVNIATEISENIATMIFFQSYRSDDSNENIESEDDAELKNIKMDELWIQKTPDELYEDFYKDESPLSKGYKIIAGTFPARRRSNENDEEVYKEEVLEEIQRKKDEAIRRQYKNTFKNYNQTVSHLTTNYAENITDSRVKNSEYYNVALLEYAYYKLYLEISTKKQQYEIAMTGDKIEQFPMSISFEVDGITGILPTQAFKVKFDSFPMQYNMDYNEIIFVVNELNHSFQNNSWETSIGGLMYINPSQLSHTNVRNRQKNKETELNRLKTVFINEINKLIGEDEQAIEDLKKRINLDSL